MWTTLFLTLFGGSAYGYSGTGADPCDQYSQPLEYISAEVTYDGVRTAADSIIVVFEDGTIVDMVDPYSSGGYTRNTYSYGYTVYGMDNPGGTCTATATVGQASETRGVQPGGCS